MDAPMMFPNNTDLLNFKPRGREKPKKDSCFPSFRFSDSLFPPIRPPLTITAVF